MNSFDMENELSRHGFSGKDIAAMKKALRKDGSTYLTLLGELRGRFVVSCVLIAILCAVWVFYFFHGEKGELLSFSITMLIVAPIFYFMTPMKLGFKAFVYKMKN